MKKPLLSDAPATGTYCQFFVCRKLDNPECATVSLSTHGTGHTNSRFRLLCYQSPMHTVSYSRQLFPAEVIQHAVWLYFRFPLSFRNVEDLLAQRGIDVSYEVSRISCYCAPTFEWIRGSASVSLWPGGPRKRFLVLGAVEEPCGVRKPKC